MKTAFIRLAVAGLILVAGSASADVYREVWSCQLENGKTMQEVQAVNSKWLAWVHKNVDKAVESGVSTTVVGELEGFLFIDTYPSIEVWAAVKAALQTEEGQAIEAGFEGLTNCKQNWLMKHEPTS